MFWDNSDKSGHSLVPDFKKPDIRYRERELVMRKTMVIPTYWGRNSDEEWQEGDGGFDHPTPLDREGTLRRTLESMKILDQRDFKLVILVCPTAEMLEDEVTDKVKKIIREANVSVETYIFTPRDLEKSMEVLKQAGVYAKAFPLLDLKHYATVRNVCLFTAAILAAEAVILIDDDEVFELPDFIPRSMEFLGQRIYGDVVYGVAGYYLNKDDRYYDDVAEEGWMTYWDRFGTKARGFDKIIGRQPRLKRTPFAFGGAMIMHKELFHTVPFDPMITRGEDVDYVINSRMYGFSFFLDNTLSIKHLPEPKSHPRWRSMREDIYRFVYEKEKIASQYETDNMTMISAEEFNPYPGEFLGSDLEDNIYRSNMMSAMDYISEGDSEGALEAMENIRIAKKDAAPEYNAFTRYREAQKNWIKVIRAVKENRYELRKIMEANNLTQPAIIRDEEHVKRIGLKEITEDIMKQEFFSDLNAAEAHKVAEYSNIKTFYENERVFSSGDINDSMYLILKGVVSLSIPGDETEVALLGKGDIVGESCLVHESFGTNCTAREFTEFLIMSRDNMNKLLSEDPVLGTKILRIVISGMARKISDSNQKIHEIMYPREIPMDE